MIYLADDVNPTRLPTNDTPANARGSRSSAAEVVDWDLEATSPVITGLSRAMRR